MTHSYTGPPSYSRDTLKRALLGELLESSPRPRTIADLGELLMTTEQEALELAAELVEDGLVEQTRAGALATRAAVVADSLQL